MTTPGNKTINEMCDQRFARLNVMIQDSIDRIAKLEGKGPFELNVVGAKGVIVHNTTVKQLHGNDWTWTRGNDLRDELKNHEIVSLQFRSEDDGRTFEFGAISLDETGVPTQPESYTENRKPQVAGASAR